MKELHLKLLTYNDNAAEPPGPGVLATEADPRDLPRDGVQRLGPHFPKFPDGRAFRQAFLLRRRREFHGEIRATGDVLVDQLAQMERSGFDVAVLRADQPLDVAQRVLASYPGFGVGRYQGDAVQIKPHFSVASTPTESSTS